MSYSVGDRFSCFDAHINVKNHLSVCSGERVESQRSCLVFVLAVRINGPHHKKTYFRCFRPGHAQLQRLARMFEILHEASLDIKLCRK